MRSRPGLEALKAAARTNPLGETPEYDVYPPNLWDPFRTRRFQNGEDLYDRPVSMFVADFIGESSMLRGRLERGGDGAHLARDGSRWRVGDSRPFSRMRTCAPG